jgi:carboxyl-terminal processing protease
LRRQFAAICAAVLFVVSALAETDNTGLGPEAGAELRAAIDALKAQHINRDKVDWGKLEAGAFAEARDAKTAADTYPAIRTLINALGEKHTFLQGADAFAAMLKNQQVGNAAPPKFNPPEAWLLDGHVALLHVPGFMGDENDDRVYVGTLRRALNRFAEHGICRFVVDLRGNWGGNMHPMQSGLAALLGTPPYGYMIFSTGKDYAFGGDRSPTQWDDGKPPLPPYTDVVAKIAHPHVAVMIDGGTASSGEFTAIAFEGLAYARSFGTPSGGFVTNNSAAALPDGARLFISNGWSTDRLHRAYRKALIPDEQSAPGQPTVDAALNWLKSQHCR